MQRNPFLAQVAPLSRQEAVPLVLIHDGGGTTFSYHCLGSLKRTVYTIHNPRFYSGKSWAGGINTMGRVYADLIRTVITAGKVILGGWSLGGLLSLEIASVLRDSTDITVVGLVMIDSIFPGALKSQIHNVVSHAPIFSDHCKPEIRLLVSNLLKVSSKMVEEWIMPSWPQRPSSSPVDPKSRLKNVFNNKHDNPPYIPSSEVLTTNSGDSSCSKDNDTYRTPPKGYNVGVLLTPPTVLLRCQDYVPVSKVDNPNAISRVDVARHCDLLGWEHFGPDLIQLVLDIPGHHFNLFSKEHIRSTEKQIVNACEMLEELDIKGSIPANMMDANYF